MYYLSQHPTVADILVAVHKVTVKSKGLKRRKKKMNEKQFEEGFNELPFLMGQPPEAGSGEFQDSLAFAQEVMGKMGMDKQYRDKH